MYSHRLQTILLLGITVLLQLTTAVAAEEAAASSPSTQSAIFAGGCFWCMEPPFEDLKGVQSVISGYIGGKAETANYRAVSSGTSRHTEAIKVSYDSSIIGYEDLLNVFWKNIDPFAVNRQFCDAGTQYRSGVYFQTKEEEALALSTKKKLREEHSFEQEFATEILPAGEFYHAEEYHQDYYKKNPLRYKTYSYGCGRARRLKEVWGN